MLWGEWIAKMAMERRSLSKAALAKELGWSRAKLFRRLTLTPQDQAQADLIALAIVLELPLESIETMTTPDESSMKFRSEAPVESIWQLDIVDAAMMLKGHRLEMLHRLASRLVEEQKRVSPYQNIHRLSAHKAPTRHVTPASEDYPSGGDNESQEPGTKRRE